MVVLRLTLMLAAAVISLIGLAVRAVSAVPGLLIRSIFQRKYEKDMRSARTWRAARLLSHANGRHGKGSE